MPRAIDSFLEPPSVAVIGASDRARSVGAKVARNLLDGGFRGPVWFVNARHDQVAGKPAFATVAQLPEAPGLAVLCTPAPTLPALVAALGDKGCRAAVIITAGLDVPGPDGRSIAESTLAAARSSGVRLLGPNCVGLLSPGIGLNASFAHRMAPVGDLALIAQSGALTTALLDWASAQGIGFSHCLSLGNALDVGFPELLDALAADAATRSILLYVESVPDGPRFLAAARNAALAKPVIVVKSGRAPEGARAAASHTGALAGADDVYDAAFRRAGLLRVDSTRELFDVAEALARCRPIHGERLAIVTNGGGPAILATDALIAAGGRLAALMPATLAALDAVLPGIWSHGNPVDIVGDAPPERYAQALQLTLADPQVDAVLLIHAPTAIVPAEEIAAACAPLLAGASRPALTCWMGGEAVRSAAAQCTAQGLPVYETPEEAVDGFLSAVHYQRLRDRLSRPTPSPPAPELVAVLDALLAPARQAQRAWLSEVEAKSVLAACGIPVVATQTVADPAAAGRLAAELGVAVALKILSPDITHKSDVGGVALGLLGAAAVETAARAMQVTVAARCPAARLEGYTVQPMVDRGEGEELLVGIATDRTFGRVLLFGAGGIACELKADKALDLLPVDAVAAEALIARTRVARLLAGYRGRPAADQAAIVEALLRLSALAVAAPDIAELDINPLLAMARGVIALDARIRLQSDG